jgi:hypothetical protein
MSRAYGMVFRLWKLYHPSLFMISLPCDHFSFINCFPTTPSANPASLFLLRICPDPSIHLFTLPALCKISTCLLHSSCSHLVLWCWVQKLSMEGCLRKDTTARLPSLKQCIPTLLQQQSMGRQFTPRSRKDY